MTRVRLTAAERREQVVGAALRRFAVGGLHGTSTEDIAADVELSQPYLFRLFRTKRDLFLACCDECHARIHQTFADACAGEDPEARLESMGTAYVGLLADRHLLRFQLQMYAASADPDIRAAVRDGYRAIVDDVRERSGVDEQRLRAFFAEGMLLNVIVTLELEEIAGEDAWAAAWCDPGNFEP